MTTDEILEAIDLQIAVLQQVRALLVDPEKAFPKKKRIGRPKKDNKS